MQEKQEQQLLAIAACLVEAKVEAATSAVSRLSRPQSGVRVRQRRKAMSRKREMEGEEKKMYISDNYLCTYPITTI